MLRYLRILIVLGSLCRGLAWCETLGSDASTDIFRPANVSLDTNDYLEGLRKDFEPPLIKQAFSLELGPKLIELKALYMEKRNSGDALTDPLSDANTSKWGRYFDLLASGSYFGGRLVGEGELAYGSAGSLALNDQRPLMSRLSLKGNFGDTTLGALHRTFGSGFIPLSGAVLDHDRAESQMWGEHNFGLFRLKATAGQLWERNSTTNEFTLTKTAATFFNLNRPGWNTVLSSSYSVIGRGEDAQQKTLAFAHGFSVAYRPITILTIQPNLTFSQEWDRVTGFKTDTPSGGISLLCSPLLNLQLNGRASYARGVSEDPLRDTSTLNTAAIVNWKLGNSPFGEQSLSLQVEYKNTLDSNPAIRSQSNITGLVQFRIAGF
jgi:hypothetical protein